MKYRYTVTMEGTCEANTPAEAETAALWEVDNGLQAFTAVDVEPAEPDKIGRALLDKFGAEPLTKGEGEE